MVIASLLYVLSDAAMKFVANIVPTGEAVTLRSGGRRPDPEHCRGMVRCLRYVPSGDAASDADASPGRWLELALLPVRARSHAARRRDGDPAARAA